MKCFGYIFFPFSPSRPSWTFLWNACPWAPKIHPPSPKLSHFFVGSLYSAMWGPGHNPGSTVTLSNRFPLLGSALPPADFLDSPSIQCALWWPANCSPSSPFLSFSSLFYYFSFHSFLSLFLSEWMNLLKLPSNSVDDSQKKTGIIKSTCLIFT